MVCRGLASLMQHPQLREMRMSYSPNAAHGLCHERSRLFADFKSTHQRLMQIHDAKMRAVLAEDFTMLEQLRAELVEIRKRRDEVAEALQLHLREHGCRR